MEDQKKTLSEQVFSGGWIAFVAGACVSGLIWCAEKVGLIK